MAKAKFSVDKMIEQAAKAQIEEAMDEFTISAEDAIAGRVVTAGPQELALDNLLAGCPGSEGYYLKLYKMQPNGKGEYKIRLDDYQGWSDLEEEISSIVRKFTLTNPKAWGSGEYRVHIMRNGYSQPQRGVQRFQIDASAEEAKAFITPSVISVQDKLADAAQLINSVKSLVPTPEATNNSNAEMQKLLVESFTKGMELAQSGKAMEATGNNQMVTMMLQMQQQQAQMMTTVLTALLTNRAPVKSESDTFRENIDLMHKLGIIGAKKEVSFAEQLREMKELGFLPSGNGGVADRLGEVKEFVSIAGELAGFGGEKGSTWDRVLDLLVPKVPEIVANITSAVSDYSNVARHTIKHNTLAALPSPIPKTEQENDMSLYGFHPLFKELYKAAELHDTSKFSYITDKIVVLLGEQIIKDTVTGIMTAEKLSGMIQQYGGHRFKDPAFGATRLLPYLQEYTAWCKSSFDVKPIQAPPVVPSAATPQPTPIPTHPASISYFITKCNKCGDELEWDSKDQFETDENNHICGAQMSDNTLCDGVIQGFTEEQVH